MITARRNSMKTELVDVSPALAQTWLNKNHSENRVINPVRVIQYARMMSESAWLPTGESIKFDTLDRLMDGQHRLLAVIKAGITVPMFVTTGLDPAVFHVIDHGFARTTLWWAPKDHRATTMAMAHLRGGVYLKPAFRMTENEAAEFYERHFSAVSFACSALPKARGINAFVRAVMGRAYYHVDHETLHDFSECLFLRRVDESKSRQIIVMRLRDVLLGTANSHGARETKKSRYLKMERAIQAFANYERVVKLYEAKGELFPIPEDAS